MLFPFETLWSRARAGELHVGDEAPDFRLSTLDKTSQISLASFRGSKAVVLVFGSYT
jgi:peroxiredoxin